MLRVTRADETDAEAVLRVEGRVVAEWVSVLEGECLALLARGKTVELEFAHVTFADARGVAMLGALRRRGVRIVNATVLIDELLKGDGVL